LQNEPHLLDKAFNLVGDARAAAFLFAHADHEMQARFLDALDRALACAPHPVTLPRLDQRDQFKTALLELRRNLRDVIPADGLQMRRKRVDARLAILTSTVDADELAQFRDDIRVQLDWERLVRERWPIRVESLTKLDGWFTPWYVDSNGQPSGWQATGARPLSIAEWRQAGDDHAEKIEAIRQSHGDGPTPALTVIAWALPDGQRVVLDGNHRLAASSRDDATAGPAIAAIVVEGPVDEGVLPDLRHWAVAGDTRSGEIPPRDDGFADELAV
jgi:hypothetical protein